MNEVISLFLYSRYDTFSRGMLKNIQSVSGSKITCICVNNQEVKKRVIGNLGDIQIPALVVKDVEGNVDIITGKKLQQWINGLVEYSQSLTQNDIPQNTQLDFTENTSIEESDEGMPTRMRGEDLKDFQRRINEYYKKKNELEREAKSNGRGINIGAIITQAQTTQEEEEKNRQLQN